MACAPCDVYNMRTGREQIMARLRPPGGGGAWAEEEDLGQMRSAGERSSGCGGAPRREGGQMALGPGEGDLTAIGEGRVG
jgi:hypothetical protein